MNEAFVQIILGIFTLLGTITIYVLAPYIKSRTAENTRKEAAFWANIAANAAEMIFTDAEQGPLKKQKVLEFLNNLGLKVDEEQLDFLVEAGVSEIHRVQEGLDLLKKPSDFE